jgi:hypothetical protein
MGDKEANAFRVEELMKKAIGETPKLIFFSACFQQVLHSLAQ